MMRRCGASGDRGRRDHDVEAGDALLERVLLRFHLLGRQFARVPTLRLCTADAEVEPVGAKALDLLAYDRPDVEPGDDGTESARRRDRLQSRNTGADHEQLRRRYGPGGGHQHREEAGEMLGGEQRALVAAHCRLRRERVHRLGARRAWDRLHRERDHALRSESFDAGGSAIGSRKLIRICPACRRAASASSGFAP